MDLNSSLKALWTQNYISNLPKFVADRGYGYSKNCSQKELLITGMNPSFRKNEDFNSFGYDFQNILTRNNWDPYWTPVKNMLLDTSSGIDLIDRSAYLDLFYFRQRDQIKIKQDILKRPYGVRFLADQLKITQQELENIVRPRVIIVKNRESAMYWGEQAQKGIIWMGYKIEFIKNFPSGKLYKITGLIESNKRIAPEIDETNLRGTLILFSVHINHFTKEEKKPTAVLLDQLLRLNAKSF